MAEDESKSHMVVKITINGGTPIFVAEEIVRLYERLFPDLHIEKEESHAPPKS